MFSFVVELCSLLNHIVNEKQLHNSIHKLPIFYMRTKCLQWKKLSFVVQSVQKKDMLISPGLGIRSLALSLFALSLKIAHIKEWLWEICSCCFLKNEPPWVNRSCRSLQKSNSEQIALVTLFKRATLSKSLLISTV